MSGALPKNNFATLNLQNNQKTLLSVTDSGKSFRRQIQGQRFSFTVSYETVRVCTSFSFHYEAKK